MFITMKVLFFYIFLIILKTVLTERGAPCISPNGENVTCVPLSSCHVLLRALLSGNETAAQFAKQSECGFDDQTLICCGKWTYFLFADIFDKGPSQPTRISKPELETEILANFKTNELPDRNVCGLEKKDDRIVGGELTHIDELPWMVALEYKSKRDGSNAGIRCGGSVINNRYVLTAAHCLRHIEFELISAWLGEWKISTDPDCEKFIANTECAPRVERINIKDKIPHPFYSKRSKKNDIGLIRLERDIRYTDYIRPICMPPPDLPDPALGILVTIAGWGVTENGTTSDVKLKVQVPLLSNNICKNKLEDRSISIDHLCAGGQQGKDSCQGDSGGPLMRTYEDKLTQQNQWYQEGIVSWGIGCGIKDYPAVYTRTSRYIVWILNNIKDD